jgi:hypothetical protein
MMQVGKALQGPSQLKLPNMDELLLNIDMSLEEFNLMFETTAESMEMMDSTKDQAITDQNVNDVLSEIDIEIMIETTDQLPTAQGTKVSGLQDELERMRDKK